MERKPALPVTAFNDLQALRSRLSTRAALASVTAALFLLGLKAWAAMETGSMAMLGSLADTGARPHRQPRHARRGADRRPARRQRPPLRPRQGRGVGRTGPDRPDHLVGAGHRLALGERLAAGAETGSAELGIAVSLAAMAVTFALIAYQRHVIARTGSVAIATDRVHYQSDLLLNGSVIAALMLDQYAGLTGADALFGLLIAAWLAVGGLALVDARDQPVDGPRMARGAARRIPRRRRRISRACRPPRPSHPDQRIA